MSTRKHECALLRQCSQDLHELTPDKIQAWSGESAESPTPAEELLVTDSYGEKES